MIRAECKLKSIDLGYQPVRCFQAPIKKNNSRSVDPPVPATPALFINRLTSRSLFKKLSAHLHSWVIKKEKNTVGGRFSDLAKNAPPNTRKTSEIKLNEFHVLVSCCLDDLRENL